MTAADALHSSSLPPVRLLQAWQWFGLWVLSLALLLAWLGVTPVSRTQEARVLETARQMLPRPWPDWLVPKLNDALRLQKPPLCYWMTAAAYEAGGVSEGVGRIPMALLGWLTVGLVFCLSRELFDESTALLSALMLLGSYLFFRHMRLAETDAPSTFFVTLAIYSVYRAGKNGVIWLHLAAAATAGALMSKGGPVAYPVLFFISYAIVEKHGRLLKRSISSGAVLTLLVLGLPWFVYVLHRQGSHVFFSEAAVLAKGENHFQWPWVYLPWTFVAIAPWCLVLPVAAIDVFKKLRTSASIRLLLIWSLAILVPLCFIGNKQKHYVLPLTPPLIMLCGQCIIARAREWKPMRWALIATMLGAIGCIPAILWFAREQRGAVTGIDAVAATAVALTLVITSVGLIRYGTAAGYITLALCFATIMPVLIGAWLGGIYSNTPRQLAMTLRASHGNGPYLFFGPNVSLPLCFNLREPIGSATTVDELEDKSTTGTIVIAQTKALGAPPPLPGRFTFLETLSGNEQKIDLYRDNGP